MDTLLYAIADVCTALAHIGLVALAIILFGAYRRAQRIHAQWHAGPEVGDEDVIDVPFTVINDRLPSSKEVVTMPVRRS